jgi:hypothetical protein
MPIGPVVEVAAQVVVEGATQVVGEVAADTLHRRFGWKGCVFPIVLVFAVIGLLIYFH